MSRPQPNKAAVTLDEVLSRVVELNCECCQGHSIPGRKEGENGHCPVCAGTGYEKINGLEAMWPQDREAVLRAEVIRLRPELKGRI